MGSVQRTIREHIGLPQVLVHTEELDLDGGPHCTSFGMGSELLRDSILRVGVVNPPLVTKSREGGWEVVNGFRRLRVLRDLGCPTFTCHDLSRFSLSTLDLLLVGLHENLATRSLNDVERAMALSRLSNLVAGESLLETHMPLLGLPSRKNLLKSYLALEKAETQVKHAVAKDRLSMRGFQDIELWNSEDRLAVAACMNKLTLNINKQIQIIDMLQDIMGKEGVSANAVLESEPFRSILSQANENVPQAGGRLLDSLRRRRFPSLDDAERAFQARVKRLGLPQGVRVSHSPHFEEQLFRVEITFKSGPELRERISLLSEIQGLESLGPPWETDVE